MEDIKLSDLSIEEKISLLSGKDMWTTKSIKKGDAEIPSVMVSDGPHGLRKQLGSTDNLGVGKSAPAVCFPTASALACSFDTDLVYEIGQALGEECLEEGVSVLLGPGICQKRNPLCGRNFEYFSEDPLVSGEMGAAWINGVESTGTGTSLKHFAVNNQEKRRMTISAILDERTLRETYLRAFQIALKKSTPATVMCSYNKINGVYSSENPYLLKKILREEFGYKGIVISDWGAVHDRTLGVKAGLNIEMPGNNGLNDKKVYKAYQDGQITEQEIDAVVSENIAFANKYRFDSKQSKLYDRERHHTLAAAAAANSAVLLKNEDDILPLNKHRNILVVGEFAEHPRYQGAGSSKINPVKLDIPKEIFEKEKWDFKYVRGYDLKEKEDQKKLSEEALDAAKNADTVLVFAGLPEGYESEGFDRADMKMPEYQNRLIEALTEVNKNIVVVLLCGAPVELDWVDKVKGILLMYLGGEAMGTAVEAVLTGRVTPSGKLAETWPLLTKDAPSFRYFPGGVKNVEYREGIFIGYRYFDSVPKEVRYPFGYGLSYTSFEYSDIKADREIYGQDDVIKLSFKIKNTGKVDGSETVFVFSHTEAENVFFPEKELRDFVKIHLMPGEEKTVERLISVADLAYYNTKISDFYVRPGSYDILIGRSALDIEGQISIRVEGEEKPEEDYRKLAPSYFKLADHVNGRPLHIPSDDFRAVYGRVIPPDEIERPFTMENTLEDAKDTFVGKMILKYVDKVASDAGNKEEGQQDMISAGIREMPFYGLVAAGGDMMPEETMKGLLDMMNGHFIKGIGRILKKDKKKN